MKPKGSVFRVQGSAKLRRGLSLVELMISLAIAALLLTGVAAAYTASANAIDLNDRFFRASQAARVSMHQILSEIRRSEAVQVPSATQVDLITSSNRDRRYKFVSTTKKLMLVTNDVTTDPDYTLASNVASCAFVADSEADPVTHINRVVRVTVTIIVQIGDSNIRLNGSAAPRRSLVY